MLRARFDVDVEEVDQRTQLTFCKRSDARVAITVELPPDYPLVEPSVNFRITTPKLTSPLSAGVWHPFSRLTGVEWQPTLTVGDMVETAFLRVEKSILQRDNRVPAVAIALFLFNIAFGAWFCWSVARVMVLRLLASTSEQNPLVELLAQAGTRLFPKGGSRQAKGVMKLFPGEWMFNLGHLIVVGGLLVLLLGERQSALRRPVAVLLAAMIVTNPITVFFTLSNRLANLGLALFAWAVLLLQQREVDLAVASLVCSQCFHPKLVSVFSCELLAVLWVYGGKEHQRDALRPRLALMKRVVRLASRVGIYSVCLLLLARECSAETWTRFSSACLTAVRANFRWLPVSIGIVCPQLAVISLRSQLAEKDNRRLLVTLLLLYELKGSHGGLAAELAVLFLLADAFVQKRDAFRLGLLWAVAVAIVDGGDRSHNHILTAAGVQAVNLMALCARNHLMYRNSECKARLVADWRVRLGLCAVGLVVATRFGLLRATCVLLLTELTTKAVQDFRRMTAKRKGG